MTPSQFRRRHDQVAPHETVRFRLESWLYRTLPPLKYWAVRQGYLKRIGWIKSNWAGLPVDADGGPLPWLTYPAIEFLSRRVRPNMRVFEFGSGQSTHWWASRVSLIHSVEDALAWFERVSPQVPKNVDLRFEDSSTGAYARSIGDRGELFNVVVIDGSVRNECVRHALPYLSTNGVVIFDNTEEPNVFGEGLELLARNGFRRIDFYGLAPATTEPHATSVLYRPGANCFDI